MQTDELDLFLTNRGTREWLFVFDGDNGAPLHADEYGSIDATYRFVDWDGELILQRSGSTRGGSGIAGHFFGLYDPRSDEFDALLQRSGQINMNSCPALQV